MLYTDLNRFNPIRPEMVESWLKGTTLRSSIRAAHLPCTLYHYFMLMLIISILSILVFSGITTYLIATGSQLLPNTHNIYAIPFLFILLVPTVIVCMYTYPAIRASGRKTSINLDLPYTITYMQALSTTMTLYAVIRKVYEADDLFGEVSKEFGLIVRDVEIFGDDLYTAIRALQKITPSKDMEEFLNDLLLLSSSGGDITNFLAARSAYFRETAAREMETLLKTIEIMAEVYVTAFVAGPITMIIMIVAQNLGGQANLSVYIPLIILSLVLGSIGMIYILYLMLPVIKMTITQKRVEDSEFADILTDYAKFSTANKAFLKYVQGKRRRMKLLNLIKNPIKTYISDYNYGIALTVSFAVIICVLYYFGFLSPVLPFYSFEGFLCLLIIIASIPISLAHEGRSWFINNIEHHTPEFLRQLIDLKDVGVTIQTATDLISQSKLGLLSQELVLTSEDMRRGSTIANAFTYMGERIGIVSVKRPISLLVKASEVTDYIKDILIIAINDFEHYLKLKKDRFNVAIVYVMIVYLSVGIYFYTAYALNVSFIASFADFNLPFDTMGNLLDMFQIGIVLSFFSGLMAGQLSSNSILAGLKHAIVLLVGAFFLFIYIVPYQMIAVGMGGMP